MALPFVQAETANPHPRLAVVSCLFSPWEHARRRANYQVFRSQFRSNYFAAEITYEDASRLTAEDPSALNLKGSKRHILWQKERLLNETIRRLPSSIEYVAWIDADILFSDPEWPTRAVERLQGAPVLQLFDRVIYLDAERRPLGFGQGLIEASTRFGEAAFTKRAGAAGFAWAARREFLERIRLLDFLVLGGSDTYMASGFAGVLPKATMGLLPEAAQRCVQKWAGNILQHAKGRVTYLPGGIFHLFHGDLSTRKYLERHTILKEASFNPEDDIRIDSSGLYEWCTPKDDLHAKVRDYFQMRSMSENS
jgi:hypothetical protein